MTKQTGMENRHEDMDRKKSAVQGFFDEDAFDYEKYKYVDSKTSYMAVRQKHVVDVIECLLPATGRDAVTALDAGCGPGLLVEILNRLKVRCLGFDISTSMLKLAHARMQARDNALLMQADIERIPVRENSLDLVVSLGVIEYLEHDGKALAEINRIMKPGGHFVTAVSNAYAYNLLFDTLIEALKKRRSTSVLISWLKKRMHMGAVKPRAFSIRKYNPHRFRADLGRSGFAVMQERYFGLNILPYPLSYFSSRLNALSMRAFDRCGSTWLRHLGEGYLVVCRK